MVYWCGSGSGVVVCGSGSGVVVMWWCGGVVVVCWCVVRQAAMLRSLV